MIKLNDQKRVQFIHTSYPANASSATVQRRVHSHAARTAHAKARHLRMIKHQASKNKTGPPLQAEGGKGVQGLYQARSGAVRSSAVNISIDAIEAEKPVVQLPSPTSLLAPDRRDPFQSFARSFQPMEHFLLDHCESSEYFKGFHHLAIATSVSAYALLRLSHPWLRPTI